VDGVKEVVPRTDSGFASVVEILVDRFSFLGAAKTQVVRQSFIGNRIQHVIEMR
jgi:hypothetical protein